MTGILTLPGEQDFCKGIIPLQKSFEQEDVQH